MTSPPDDRSGPGAAFPEVVTLVPVPTWPMPGRAWLVLGAAFGFLSVALSAYAAHAPFAAEPGRARMIGNALTMGGWHALALLAVGLLAERTRGTDLLVHGAGAAFALGVVLFCGAVWWQALVGTSPGPVAPVGGLFLLAGWALLAAGAWRATTRVA